MGGVTLAVIAVIAFAYTQNKNFTAKENTGFGKVLENKWYVDEIYEAVIVKPIENIGAFFSNIMEKKGIDGLVNGVGRAVNYGSRQIRLLQTGHVGTYVLLMVIGILVLFIVQMFL